MFDKSRELTFLKGPMLCLSGWTELFGWASQQVGFIPPKKYDVAELVWMFLMFCSRK